MKTEQYQEVVANLNERIAQAKELAQEPELTVSPQESPKEAKQKPSVLTYQTRWKRKALELMERQKKGAFLDRRQRRLVQQYKQWQLKQNAKAKEVA